MHSAPIDAHAHVAALTGRAVTDNDAFPAAPPVTAPVEQLLREMDATGVEHAVLVQPSMYGFDHSYLMQCLREHSARLAGIALANVEDPAFVDELTELVGTAPVRGIRLAPLSAPHLGWFDSHTEPLYEAVATLGLSVSLLVSPAWLPVATRWIHSHPELTVVIDHLGRPDLAEDPTPIARDLLDLARCERVFIKVSALPEMSARPFPHEDVWPWVRAVFTEFGAERLLWGSDFPFATSISGYGKSLRILDYCAGISPHDRDRIISGTAREIFRLADPKEQNMAPHRADVGTT